MVENVRRDKSKGKSLFSLLAGQESRSTKKDCKKGVFEILVPEVPPPAPLLLPIPHNTTNHHQHQH